MKAYDPVAADNTRSALGTDGIEYCDSLGKAVTGVDAVVLMTRWEEFHRLPELIRSTNPGAAIVDGRRMLDRSAVDRYVGVGLGGGS